MLQYFRKGSPDKVDVNLKQFLCIQKRRIEYEQQNSYVGRYIDG